MRKIFLVFSIVILTVIAKAQNLPYVNQTDVGLLFGDEELRSFSIQTFSGVVIEKWKLQLGLVTGIDVYQQITLIPLAPSFKYFPFSNKKTNPFLSLNVGYAFSGLKKFDDNQVSEGGLLINPSLGLRFKTQRKAAFNFNLGYKTQKGTVITYTDNFSSPNPRLRNKVVDEYTFKRVSMTLGISF